MSSSHATSSAGPARSLRLAHVSDPHLTSLAHVTWRELLNKRVLGYASWLWRRRREHRREVLDALVRDLAEAAPDHIALTGDLTHVGTPGECREAAEWLRAFGPPDRISLVPGNHDRYVRADWNDTAGRWLAWMQGDEPAVAGAPDSLFPYLRRRGPVSLIGLTSSVPTPPFFASGRLGREQIRRAAELLRAEHGRGAFRVVLLHHPPLEHSVSPRRRLTDSRDFLDMMKREGAELVLHGHAHRFTEDRFEWRGRPVPVLCVPSASAKTSRRRKRAGYNICEIAATAGGWRLTVTSRVHVEETETFEECGRKEYVMQSAAAETAQARGEGSPAPAR